GHEDLRQQLVGMECDRRHQLIELLRLEGWRRTLRQRWQRQGHEAQRQHEPREVLDEVIHDRPPGTRTSPAPSCNANWTLVSPGGLLHRAAPADLERARRREVREDLHEPRDDAGPSGLMAGAEAGAVVAVEVFVEEDQVTP